MSYNFDIRPMIFIFIILGAFIMGVVWFTFSFISSDDIKVKKKLSPDVCIVITNGVADTTYIYKAP